MTQQESTAAFDEFAGQYDSALNQGLSLTGESKDYYAQARVQWSARRIDRIDVAPNPEVIDYGCGTGSTTPIIRDYFNAATIIGLDVSHEELAIARREHAHPKNSFRTIDNYRPAGSADVVYCNGTFHHIPPAQRPQVMQYISDCLKPGGFFALWENNPWNPGTRIIMSKIPFDRDAITLTPPESRRLLRSAGFEVLRTDSLFYFPRRLAFLRPMERFLSVLPLGGQYLVLARKPKHS